MSGRRASGGEVNARRGVRDAADAAVADRGPLRQVLDLECHITAVAASGVGLLSGDRHARGGRLRLLGEADGSIPRLACGDLGAHCWGGRRGGKRRR